VSYAIAISIDVTVYLLSYTAFKRYRKYRTAKAVWQHWLLIVICTFFSWAVNWAYAKQFHSLTMLSSAESAAPWLTSVFPFMASAFPLLGIVYTMMAETISETEENPSLATLTEIIKQKQLPAILRQSLASGQAQAETALLGSAADASNSKVQKVQEETSKEKEEDKQKAVTEPLAQAAITGQFIALDPENLEFSQLINDASAKGIAENNSDKLQMALKALRDDPNMNDESLAKYLSLKRSASARFWRLKALEILNAPEKEENNVKVPARNAWATTSALTNGRVAKR
jgi:hypothetical protein